MFVTTSREQTMEERISIQQSEFDCLIKIYSAVLDWKSARVSILQMQRENWPEEKVAEVQERMLACELALSRASSSDVCRSLFLATLGLYPVSGAEAA
jgi:hypothetical protein